MAINRQQTQRQSVNIPGAGEIEIPTINNSRGIWDYPEADWSLYTLTFNPMAFLYLVGHLKVDGVDVDKLNCRAPQDYSQVDLWHEYITGSGWNQCNDDCEQSCMESYSELSSHYSYNTSTYMCGCYCTTSPLDCNLSMAENESYLIDLFPNNAVTSSQNPSGNGDAIGVFYEGTLIGWDFASNMTIAPTSAAPPVEGGNYNNDVYDRFSLPGVIIPLSFHDPQQPQTDIYPEQGTILNSSNTEIIYYKADTQTFHSLVGNSPQDIFNTQIPLFPMSIAIIAGPIDAQNFTFVFDSDGNAKHITDFGPEMLTFTWGPPLQEQTPLPLPPIADCRTTEDCRDGFICRAGKCVSPTSAPIGRTTQDRQLQDVEKKVEDVFNVNQTSNQAFYFFNITTIERNMNMTLTTNHHIFAKCNNVVVGSRKIEEDVIDVPVMGVDDVIGSENYCLPHQIPEFFIYDYQTKKEYPLNNYDINGFKSLLIQNVNF